MKAFPPDVFSAEESRYPFWINLKERYDERSGSRKLSLTPGESFWFKDDMDYDVAETVGQGQFATVLRAKARKTGRIFAVKRFEVRGFGRVRNAVRHESQLLDTVRHGVSASLPLLMPLMIPHLRDYFY